MYIDTRALKDGSFVIDLFDKKDNYYFGFIEIEKQFNCYVVSGKINHFEKNDIIDLFETRKEKLRNIFVAIQAMILEGAIPIDLNEYEVYILDDELISRDFIKSEKLKRVPRYCGYYFI
jgi:hypothetical protein